MTRSATIMLGVFMFIVSVLGGCGKDPYVGESTSPARGGAKGGTGGSSIPTGGTTGVKDATVNYKLSISTTRLLDLVFMIDNSPSMAPKVQKMNAQFPKLIAALQDPNDGTLPDLRVAIIDSDLGSGGAYQSGSCGPNASNGYSNYGDQGKFRMINAASCGVTSSDALWLEYSKGKPVNFEADINQVFTCLAGGVGTMGCGVEHQLQAFEFALVLAGLNNEAQHLMLRGNALLGLVFLTDEDDCSAAMNDGMFGDKAELRNESASLRCATRAHACNGTNLTSSPPGYPTTAAFSASLSSCRARTDACPNVTDGDPNGTDTSGPTDCSPLKSIKKLADGIKGFKDDPDNQIFVAGIFGWPLTDADMASSIYRIDAVPNPNTADTAHPAVFDLWPVCYDPDHKPADATKFDPVAAGWGATAGLREAAFIDEFGANGQKFSICQADFTSSMKTIGDSLAKKLKNLCINDKLLDKDLVAQGPQPDCDAHYLTPTPNPSDPAKVIYMQSLSLPLCPVVATPDTISQDCWQLTSDMGKCPGAFNGQMADVLRTRAAMNAGPLPAGTHLGLQCRVCPTSPAADQPVGCSY